MQRKHITIIGGGPAGLMAADVLAPSHEVHVYEQGKTVGRKFLVAGQGGFNLTNSIDGPALSAKYTPAGALDEALAAFGSGALRDWLRELGIETYVGSSGRVFPTRGTKPIEVLSAWRERLTERGVRFHTEHRFCGFNTEAQAIIEHAGQRTELRTDLTLFALGGASWPVTGSTGDWPALFAPLGINTVPFQASNCGVNVAWPAAITTAHAGKPLKNIRVTAGERSSIGEATITQYGLEGNAIYPVVPALRDALVQEGTATLQLDLKPGNTAEELLARVAGKEPRNYASAMGLDRASAALMKAFTTKERFLSPYALVQDVKALRLHVSSLRPIDEAISTVGGISFTDLSPDFSFKRHPHLFALGEMVGWDAPTGGFLLQGCFAIGRWAGRCILERG